MRRFLRHFGRRPKPHGVNELAKPNPGLRVLAVTADHRFYFSLLYICSGCGWRAEWARSVASALRQIREGGIDVVIYDRQFPWTDWEDGFYRLQTAPECPSIVLAAQEVNEELWRKVIECRGYDVLDREADAPQFTRMCRFACLARRGQPAVTA